LKISSTICPLNDFCPPSLDWEFSWLLTPFTGPQWTGKLGPSGRANRRDRGMFNQDQRFLVCQARIEFSFPVLRNNHRDTFPTPSFGVGTILCTPRACVSESSVELEDIYLPFARNVHEVGHLPARRRLTRFYPFPVHFLSPPRLFLLFNGSSRRLLGSHRSLPRQTAVLRLSIASLRFSTKIVPSRRCTRQRLCPVPAKMGLSMREISVEESLARTSLRDFCIFRKAFPRTSLPSSSMRFSSPCPWR